jgi:hypothetical protein
MTAILQALIWLQESLMACVSACGRYCAMYVFVHLRQFSNLFSTLVVVVLYDTQKADLKEGNG